MIAEILSGGVLSAITGAVGGYFTKRVELKAKQLELEHKAAMAKMDLQAEIATQKHELLMAEKQMERAAIDAEIQRDVAEMNTFREGLKEQTMKYGGKVDAIRGLMRPLLTTFAVIWVVVLTSMIWEKIGGLKNIPSAILQDTFLELVQLSITICGLTVGWWFASRPSQLRRDPRKG